MVNTMRDMLKHHHADCSRCVKAWCQWIKQIVIQPIQGFDHKSNPDGSYFSYPQQQQATQTQLYWIIFDLCRRKKSSADIKSTLLAFI